MGETGEKGSLFSKDRVAFLINWAPCYKSSIELKIESYLLILNLSEFSKILAAILYLISIYDSYPLSS